MKKSIKHIEFKDIQGFLDKYDLETFYGKVDDIPDSSDLKKGLEKYIGIKDIPHKSVLGVDIYQYGSYKDFEQTLIPFLFELLFERAIELCLNSNEYLFQNYTKEKIYDSFISIGDGGFIIFDNPIHSMVFALNFDMVQRSYNSSHIYPKLRNIIGGISNRYAITYDSIYHFENNYYGRAIINNARILSKDHLNRCLIAQKTYDWFLFNVDGIENLQLITLDEIHNTSDFEDYDSSLIQNGKNVIINNDISRCTGIINADILKIGVIQSKETSLNIYNMHVQATMEISTDKENETKRKITVSLGNLNTSGI